MTSTPRAVGRYLLAQPIAIGGMASVHYGKLNGPTGFRRTVAIKRLLQPAAAGTQARAMLIDEAHLSARIGHPNVVQTLDVIEQAEELLLVLEYVHGESLDRLLARCRELGRRPPTRVVAAIVAGLLRGLHAAHEARGEDGAPLELVHRDVSPHNVMVDAGGLARVLDFGVARARGRLQVTQDGQLKGKLAYLAPEQVHGETSRRSDVFSAGVVLWECLTLTPLFDGTSEGDLLSRVLLCKVPALETQGVAEPALEAVLRRMLERDPANRYATASEAADALERCGLATQAEVATWVAETAGPSLQEREQHLAELDRLVVPEAAPGPVATLPPVAPPRPAPRRLGVLLALGGALIALAGLTGALWRSQAPPDAPAEPVVQRPAPGAELPAPVAAPVPDPAPPSGPPDMPPVVEPPAAPPKRPAARPAPSCDPPWTIGADGVKKFKVECLK